MCIRDRCRHIGKLLAGQADCERTKRVHPGLLDTSAALADHMHHSRRINHGIGIGGYTDARNSPGNCSQEFTLHGGFVLFAWFAKTCLKIDESGTDDTACRINLLISGEIIPCCSRVDDKTLVDEYVANRIVSRYWINDTPVSNANLHFMLPRFLVIPLRQQAGP